MDAWGTPALATAQVKSCPLMSFIKENKSSRRFPENSFYFNFCLT